MSQIIDMQLSALLDGELPADQEALLLRRLEHDSELREKLARFSLIGECVRGGVVPTSAMKISERVSAMIAAELPEHVSAAPVSVARGFAGAGIAASIALLVMLNLSSIGKQSVPGVNVAVQQQPAAQGGEEHADSARLMRYLVAHTQFSNSASRQLVDSHIAIASVSPAAWTSHE